MGRTENKDLRGSGSEVVATRPAPELEGDWDNFKEGTPGPDFKDKSEPGGKKIRG